MSQLDPYTLKPFPPYVLVRRLDPESKISPDSKLILPDTQNFKNRRCEVIAVHGGHKFPHKEYKVPCAVKPGDLVEVVIFDGDPIGKHELVNYEFVNESNILCIVEPTEDVLGHVCERGEGECSPSV